MTDVSVTASKGIKLEKGDGEATEAFTVVAGIQDMPAMFSEKSVKDRTDLTDTIRDYGLGIGEPPRISFSLFWDPAQANHTALIAEHDNETKSNYRVVCPDTNSTTYTFKALVPKYSTPYAGVDGDLVWDVDFQLVKNDEGKIVTKGTAS